MSIDSPPGRRPGAERPPLPLAGAPRREGPATARLRLPGRARQKVRRQVSTHMLWSMWERLWENYYACLALGLAVP